MQDLVRRKGELLPKFTVYYQQLRALPRRTRRLLQRRFAQSLAGAALLLALGQGQAIAATINVTTNVPDINADGQCSLIESIVNANDDAATHADCTAGSGPDTISLPASSTHVLTAMNDSTYGPTGLPAISSAITIDGNGSMIERGAGAPDFRLLAVSSTGDLMLENLTLTGGRAFNGFFGGIGNFGGGVLSFGIVALTNSTISDNTAYLCGGGIDNRGSGTLTLSNSTVSGNTASVHGGGIYNFNQGAVTLINSTISNNTAASYGGAVYNSSVGIVTALTLINSTVSGNSAGGSGGGVLGGFPLTLINSTVSGNRAGNCGGGMGGGFPTLTRTLVSGNTASNGSEICDPASGSFTANNFNLFGNSGLTNAQAFSGFTPGATDITATSDGSNPTALTDILDTILQNNGGPTQTHALIGGSPAIDASPADADCQATDQRGVSRPQGTACDIGAFEFAPEMCGNCIDDDGDGQVDLLDDDCLPTDPLTVSKGSFTLKPDPNKDTIALKATFPSTGVTINPPVDGVAISFFDADGSIECLAIPPNSAGWKVNKKETIWLFKDAKDDSLGDPEADDKVTIKRNDKKGLYEVTINIKEAELTDPDAGLIASGVVIGNELRVNQQEWREKPIGKKLVTP